MMVTQLLEKRPINLTLNTLIVLGALCVMFTPNYLFFKIGSNFAVHIMLGYLLLGLVFLILRQPKLTFTSFLCCAGLCLFLKFYSNWDWTLPQATDESQPTVRVAHFNIANSVESYEATMRSILEVDADVLSFQEVTPDWDASFRKWLNEKYPHSTSVVRFDPYGLAIYSKRPILSTDTFYYNDIPNLDVVLQGPKKQELFRVISSYATPPLYNQALAHLKTHMSIIANKVNQSDVPVFTVGDYNAPPWWEEIRLLLKWGALSDSRSCAPQGLEQLLQHPVDYILHTDHYKCLSFGPTANSLYGHLGIQAVFQLNTDLRHVQAALQ